MTGVINQLKDIKDHQYFADKVFHEVVNLGSKSDI